MAKFKIFDNHGQHVATLFAETYEDAVNDAYEGYKGKFTKSFIRELLLTNDEVQEMNKWEEELCLAQNAGEV